MRLYTPLPWLGDSPSWPTLHNDATRSSRPWAPLRPATALPRVASASTIPPLTLSQQASWVALSLAVRLKRRAAGVGGSAGTAVRLMATCGIKVRPSGAGKYSRVPLCSAGVLPCSRYGAVGTPTRAVGAPIATTTSRAPPWSCTVRPRPAAATTRWHSHTTCSWGGSGGCGGWVRRRALGVTSHHHEPMKGGGASSCSGPTFRLPPVRTLFIRILIVTACLFPVWAAWRCTLRSPPLMTTLRLL